MKMYPQKRKKLCWNLLYSLIKGSVSPLGFNGFSSRVFSINYFFLSQGVTSHYLQINEFHQYALYNSLIDMQILN